MNSLADLPERTNSLVMSYVGIRRAVGICGLLLPVMLALGGWLIFDVEIQDSMSAYYHTPMRDVFVGTLCAMGIFLYCYRGYDTVENWTANIACVSALGLALFPLDFNSDPLLQRSLTGYVHSVSGAVFFLTFACYSLFHFPTSGQTSEETPPHERERNFVYRTSGIVILLTMAAMGTYLLLLPTEVRQSLNRFNFLFWGEWLAVWAFSAAWLTKGRIIVSEIAVDLLAIPIDLIVKRRQ